MRELNFPKRKIYPNEIIIDFPDELWYACPYNEKHIIWWSEYEWHIWCYDCQKDIPSCFCKRTLDENLEVFYSLYNQLWIQTTLTESEKITG